MEDTTEASPPPCKYTHLRVRLLSPDRIGITLHNTEHVLSEEECSFLRREIKAAIVQSALEEESE